MKKTNFIPLFLARVILPSLLFYGFVFSQDQVARLSMYDSQDNYLFFVDFEYDGLKDTAYTVYFSDTVFTRRVRVDRDGQGNRTREVGFNFDDYPVDTTLYMRSNNQVQMRMTDQFRVEQLGGIVSYNESADPNNFDVMQNGSLLNKIKYTYNGGALSRVDILDASGSTIYYGLFRGRSSVLRGATQTAMAQSKIVLKGNNILSLDFTIKQAASVKCEAISLLGRRTAVLFNGDLSQGSYTKAIPLEAAPSSLTNGVYIAVLSIDGKSTAKTKFIVQRFRGGAR